MLYLDTGCLVKLYYPEPDSDLVATRVSGETIVYTPVHSLELATALELKVFRKEASPEQASLGFASVQEDVSAGKLIPVEAPILDSLHEAVNFARRHTSTTGCRALDILHCAWAKKLNVTGFISTDTRQIALARLVGLRVLAIQG